MSRTVPTTMHDEAAQWVARMDGGDWTPADEAQLSAWLAVDSRREGELLRLQAQWVALDAGQAADDDGAAEGTTIYRRRGFLTLAGGAVAASAAGLWFATTPRSYETELGEIRRVALADGSVVAVNTASRIDVRLETRERKVKLERGEAWFQVAKNPSRPFVVEAGGVTVRAVGTAFSVRRLDHGSEVLVTEGRVETWCGTAIGKRILLNAGERAFISEEATIHRQGEMAPSIDRSLAWRAGKIDLFGDSLSAAVDEFNRYNRRKLVLIDPKYGSEQLDGVFRIDDVEGFARTVGKVLTVPVDTSDPNEVRIG